MWNTSRSAAATWLLFALGSVACGDSATGEDPEGVDEEPEVLDDASVCDDASIEVTQFYLPTWGVTCSGCSAPVCSSPSGAICFAGASQTSGQKECNPGGSVLSGFPSSATDRWYSVGGGNPQPNQYWTTQDLTDLNAFITTKDFKDAGYTGIYYDVEVLYDVSYDDFATSFSATKQAGFKVAVGTSYTAPYDCTGQGCGSYPVKWPTETDAIWKSILGNEDVDVFTPQWYSDGSFANIEPSTGSSITIQTWQDTVPAGTPIISSLKVHGGEQVMKSQIDAVQTQLCNVYPKFSCDAFWFWFGN